MKHGRGARGAAPTSNAAGRDDAQGTLMPACPATSRRVVPRGFHVLFADSRQREPTRLRFGSIRKESGRFRPKFKKRKKVQIAPFDLFLNPTSAQFHTNAKT